MLVIIFTLLKIRQNQRTRAGELIITPNQSEADWYRWLETIQDWCISRQLWWGHRCPAYIVCIEGEDQSVC
jgi:valyl-tRNA synthetase